LFFVAAHGKTIFDEPTERFARAEIQTVNRFFFVGDSLDLFSGVRFARSGNGDDD
jgi:hypothetical protein